jgi:hypothetical protein
LPRLNPALYRRSAGAAKPERGAMPPALPGLHQVAIIAADRDRALAV